MKKMRAVKQSFRLLLLLTCLPLGGVSALADGALTFTQISQLTDNPKQLQGQFQQSKYLSFLDTELKSSGRFEYQQGQVIHWLTEQPIASELVLTPKAVINKQDGEEISRLNTEGNPIATMMSRIFFAVLTADWQPLSALFTLDGSTGTTTSKSQDGDWQAKLTPINKDVARFVSHIEISGDQYLRELTFFETTGNRTHIQFSDFVPNVRVTPTTNE